MPEIGVWPGVGCSAPVVAPQLLSYKRLSWAPRRRIGGYGRQYAAFPRGYRPAIAPFSSTGRRGTFAAVGRLSWRTPLNMEGAGLTPERSITSTAVFTALAPSGSGIFGVVDDGNGRSASKALRILSLWNDVIPVSLIVYGTALSGAGGGRRRVNSAVRKRPSMMPSMGLESRTDYTELAEHCLWEAERTLDREAAQTLRTLADRYRRLSERTDHGGR